MKKSVKNNCNAVPENSIPGRTTSLTIKDPGNLGEISHKWCGKMKTDEGRCGNS